MQRIGLLDHMGLGNLGDAATQDAVINYLQTKKGDVEVALFSLNPADSEQRHGLPAFPITWRGSIERQSVQRPDNETGNDDRGAVRAGVYARTRKILRRSSILRGLLKIQWKVRQEIRFMVNSRVRLLDFDLLVISGGGQIDDSWGGPWSAPANLLRWAILARTSKTRLIFLGVGAGPLKERLSRIFCATALRLAHSISFRDEGSRKFAEMLGVRKPATVIPDLAHSFPVGNLKVCSADRSKRLVVGIGPIPYKDPRWWPDKDDTIYQAYIGALAAFASWLLENGHAIRFLVGSVRMDRSAVRDIRERIEKPDKIFAKERLIEKPIATVEEFMQEISETDIVMSSRFHGVLFAHLLLKPVIAVSYHEKIDSQMIDMGQSSSVLSCDDFTVEDLVANFEEIRSNSSAIRKNIESRVATHRDALARVYEETFGF